MVARSHVILPRSPPYRAAGMLFLWQEYSFRVPVMLLPHGRVALSSWSCSFSIELLCLSFRGLVTCPLWLCGVFLRVRGPSSIEPSYLFFRALAPLPASPHGFNIAKRETNIPNFAIFISNLGITISKFAIFVMAGCAREVMLASLASKWHAGMKAQAICLGQRQTGVMPGVCPGGVDRVRRAPHASMSRERLKCGMLVWAGYDGLHASCHRNA